MVSHALFLAKLTLLAHFGAFAALFAMHWVTAWLNYTTIDDVSAIFPLYMNEGLYSDAKCIALTRLGLGVAAITQSCNALGNHAVFDYVDPTPNSLSKLYTSGLLEKVLGAFFVLYTQKDGRMTQAAKLCWAVSNMRLLTTNLNHYNQSTASIKGPEDIKPGRISLTKVSSNSLDFQVVLGTTKWSQDILTYVFQELFDMSYELGSKISDKQSITSYSKDILRSTYSDLS
jgi:hypothetical protein